MKSFLSQKDVADVKISELHSLGRIIPNKYLNNLSDIISKCKLELEPCVSGKSKLPMYVQENPVKIEDRHFLATLICQPSLEEKKAKPAGLALNDESYFTIKELLLYDAEEKELYLYEYSYHFGIWDYDKNIECYYFRYDREVQKKNPPKKNIEHLHVHYDDPHFNSSYTTLKCVLDFISANWDESLEKFHIPELNVN
ncbi:hypothetical protein CDLVIII_3196 [Clostridium sp. DL-VIII]|uniref:DUF6516 family protein n=1 Tax=Clostridium sp. DL-VIII TaxID=641107 RepID=UPI00023AFFC9|nr:DUF6516 family protein [Clostridium sp. DL-VIII]EHI99770.1 hypothetical protein CDLVIII_3196 [Clostridium sp. DL-VIII]